MYRNLNKHLLLFADCIISKGYLNLIIFDFTRTNNSSYLPYSYLNFIENCKKSSLQEIYEKANFEDLIIIDEYIEFTLEQEFGFICDKELVKSFLPLNGVPNSPEFIDNCIVELSSIDSGYLKKLNSTFDELMVNSLEIRVDEINFNNLNLLIEVFKLSIIESISIYIDFYEQEIDKDELVELLTTNLRVKKMVFCNQVLDELFEDSKLIFTRNSLNDLLLKPIPITKVVNISYHLEAKNINPYFFKKLYIDKNGFIHNSKELREHFGNIRDLINSDDIFKIIESSRFQLLWNTPKNNIQVCSDCEFSSVCFDVRVPKTSSNNFYFEEECFYNPYIGKTKDDEGYQTLEECGVISNENGFSINHEKIAKINALLWSEEGVETE